MGRPEWSLRLLQSRVRPLGRMVVQANPTEISEYAAALSSIGATQESLGLLQPLARAGLAQALLFEAFAFMSEWNYAAAKNSLEEYLRLVPAESYDARVARVNLAAALVILRDRSALSLIQEILKPARAEGNRMLCANLLELKAQGYFFAGDYDEALKSLEAAREFVGDAESTYSYYVEKWVHLVSLFSGRKGFGVAALKEFSRRAFKAGEWEVVRDCDLYEATFNRDPALFRKLYQGSRPQAYRERVLNEAQKSLGAQHSLDKIKHGEFRYLAKSSAPGPRRIFLLSDAAFADEPNRELKSGQVLERMFRAFFRDIYRPILLGQLHAEVFPNRHYHYLHSPNSLHQALLRLRAQFTEWDWPFQVDFSRRSYRIGIARGSVEVVFSGEPAKIDHETQRTVLKLRGVFGKNSFDAWSVAEKLKLSHRSALRSLKELKDSGVIEAQRKGRVIEYRLR